LVVITAKETIMKKLFYAILSVSLLVLIAFGQAIDEASIEELKEQIKAEIIEELKAEFILTPRETIQVNSDAPAIDASSIKPVRVATPLGANGDEKTERIEIEDDDRNKAARIEDNNHKRRDNIEIELEDVPAPAEKR